MKKVLKFLVFICAFMLFSGNVKAESINKISMDIYIDEYGNAHITEKWDVNSTEKTEYYHQYKDIGNSKITDLRVYGDGKEYSLIDWDVNASLNQKAYHYGYNYINDGVEICFGKSSYNHHNFVVTYTITSFVSTIEDADLVYWTLLRPFDPTPSAVEIVIYADEPFENTLDVWGYGSFGNETSVSDGKIYITNLNTIKKMDYFVLLAKFDKGTFKTSNILDNNFDYYFKMAEEGAKHYKDGSDNDLLGILTGIFTVAFWAFIFGLIIKSSKDAANKCGTYKLDFGEKGKKLPKDVNLFRELPCGKDIYRAYWLALNYGLTKKKTDFLGAVLLKWVKQQKVTIQSEEKGIFKKEKTSIVFKENIELDTELEEKLYKYMYEASKDGILESKEFERWCSSHYSKILSWFDDVLDYESDELVKSGKLTKTEKTSLKVFKSDVYVVDSSMYEEATYLKGLKQFFKEFENMKDKEAIEVNLWEEYLMYAQIFGIAEKVAKQFKELYPDVITDEYYNSMIYVHTISNSGMTSASAARSRAESYSSGGGGFSSGGGGGGSFGGGGGSFGGGSR